MKSPNDGIRLNDPDRYPFNDSNDERLDFLHRMATSLKGKYNSLKRQRVRGLTQETSNAWYIILNGLIKLITGSSWHWHEIRLSW